MTKPRFKPYSGELSKPLPKLESFFELGERLELEHERLRLLLRHYGINEDDPACWYQLVLALAREHVSGFREEPRGRGQKWSALEEAELCLRVWSLARTNGCNESEACRQLHTELPYSRMSIEWKSLYTRFKRAEQENQLVHLLRESTTKTAALVKAPRGCD